MTLRIPSVVLLGLTFLLVSSLISFGVAFAVNEWRQSDYIDCVATAQDKLIDEYDQQQATRPIAPDAPGSGASEAAYEAYNQQWDSYSEEYDAWQERSDDINTEWGVETRACH